METLSIAKGMNGMALIGSFFGEPEKNISAIPFALAGDMDEQFYHGFFLMEFGPQVTYVENLPTVLRMVDSLKDYLRGFVNRIFQEEERHQRVAQRQRLEQVKFELERSNRPHAQGTVAEIAAKFNISKSEVRRRKAEGTLDDLFKVKA